MEVRVQKKKNKFPIDRKKLHAVWKILAVILSVCLLAGGIALIPGYFRKVQAGIDPTKYSKEHPFMVLEIVPYEGQGQWGYMVSGQEPVSAEKIRLFHEAANDEEQYWKYTNQNNTFDKEFRFSGLIREAQNKSYSNKDVFIKQILCRDGGNPEDWAGKVRVKAKTACELTVQDVKTADLVVLQSNKTAYQYNADSETPLYVYWRYNNPSIKFRDRWGTEINPSGRQQAVYEGEISTDNGTSWKKMDIEWDVALAILEHAFNNNKATIVASENSKGNAENNIDKLILLLTKLTRKAYVDDGIGDMITTVVNGNGITTGSFNGQTVWTEKLFYDALLLDRPTFVDGFEKKLKHYVYNQSDKYSPSGRLKQFLIDVGSMRELSNEAFYEFIDDDLWKEILEYAKLLRDKEGTDGKLTDTDYQWFVDCREKYGKRQICKLENKFEVGYDVLHNGGYKGKTEWDNVIRYMESWTNYPFVPALLANSAEHQIDVEEILLGGLVTPGEPPEEPEDGTVKVLEIEPCNSFWLPISGNLEKLAEAINVDEDDISVTYVTPNALNGMAVDLVAEYDLILVGDDISLFSNASGKSYSADRPYSNIGFYDDAVKTQTLLNGLLKEDYNTPNEFKDLIQKNSADVIFNLSGFIPTPSTSPYWNAGIRKQWGSNSNIYILKNIELYLQLGAPASSISSARFSGNDLSRYMQKELARYIKSGQPIVVRNKLREIATARINDFNDTDLSGSGEKNELPENQAISAHDARLYLALAGVEDEREYYDSGKNISTEYLESGAINVYSWESELETDDGTIELKTQYKPQIQISDAGYKKDENGNPLPTIIERGKPGEIKPDLSSLAKDNSLIFNYEIMLSSGVNIKDCVMTVVVDQNGDGFFDEEGEGKTLTNGKRGKQNNATDTIQNDKVYQYKFSEKQEGADYSVESDLIKGTFISEGPLNAKEEICQFRVTVALSSRDTYVPLKGAWTGYMRPALKTKDVKILQITPYETKVGGKALSQNNQFIKWIQEAEKVGEEYHFDFTNGYTEMSEDQFSQKCELGEVTIESLKEYDLIIVGTDFSMEASGNIIDTDRLKAGEVLKGYTDLLKRPIIMTNDSISYVNSANYVTPEERKYHYRYLTIAEGKELERQGKLNSSNSDLKKVKVYEEVYKGIEEKNKEIQDKDKGFEGEGTVYLDPSQEWKTEEADAGTYSALYLPVTQTMAKDGRDSKEYRIGYDLGWLLSDKISIQIVAQEVESVDVRASDFEQLLGKGVVYQPYWGIIPLPSYYTNIGYVTEQELKDWYLKEPGKENSKELRQITERISNGFLSTKKYSFFYKDIHSKFRMEIPISEKVVDIGNEIDIAGEKYYNFTDGSGKKYLATKSAGKVWKKYKEEWQIKEEIKSGETAEETQYALTDVAGEKDALYPEQNNWNYFLTQSLRYVIGMDRFAVTTDLKPEKKRDSGSSRRWAKRTAIQGFTNAALLEYAYLPPEDAAWGKGVNTKSPYADSLLKLGTAPRTNRIEMLNEGTIGLYPFSITNENYSNQKIEVARNHAPLYQLDLERETGEGKIDDVTVWFTFAGAGDGSSPQEKNESKYFDTTVRDARNNYYLYSKGKIYYTGFSLYDATEGTDSADAKLVPDMEMKLFINTIYAALNSETEESTYFDTVVREGGTVSGIELAGDTGVPNRYTCYYDEYDEALELSFRVQKIGAADGETTPLAIGKRGEKGENGLPAVNEFDEAVYTLTGLPEDNGVSNFPVVKIAGEQGTKGSLGGGASDIWYTLRFTDDKGEGKIPDDMDGMTMIIGPKAAETGTLRKDSIYAEIRFVKRNLFELD